MDFNGTRLLLSSIAETSMSTSGPSIRRSAALRTKASTTAREFDGIVERNH
jgi:hypothetical protein